MQSYIIALIVALVPFLAALAGHLYQVLYAHLPASKQAVLMNVAQTAVQAAEQSGFGGPQKKQLAENAINATLKSLGIGIDPVYVNTAIESLVYALGQQSAPVVVTSTPALTPPLTLPDRTFAPGTTVSPAALRPPPGTV